MKKSLIALAALATVATAAQAQSSVTIYGVIDMGYATINNVDATGGAKRVSGIQNGGLSTSRLGFRGTEDLGGGLKAGFTLEAEILADTGSQTSTPEALFARESSVSLGGNFGEVKLGRFNTLSYGLAAKYDPMGGNNIGGHIATGGNSLATRFENAVQYSTPKWNGLQLAVITGTRTTASSNGAVRANSGVYTYGEVAGETSGNRGTEASIEYTAGNLELAAVTGEQNGQTGSKEFESYGLNARYNFGVARVTAGYVEYKTVSSGSKTKKTFVGANVPVTAAITVNAFATEVETTSTGLKPMVYTLGANYALSKRTTLYVIGAKSSQDGNSAQAIVNSGKWNFSNAGTFTNGAAPVAGQDQTAYTVGIRHTF